MFFKQKADEPAGPAASESPPDQAVPDSPDQGVSDSALRDESGLHALWYLDLRLREELSRAGRANHIFSLAAWQVKLLPGELPGPDFQLACARLINDTLRGYDVAAQVGPGSYVAILFDAKHDDARTVTFRLKGELGLKVPSVGRWQAGLATYPEDALDGNELIQVAFRRLEADALAS